MAVWVPKERASQPQPGWPVDLVWILRSQLHTCNVDNTRSIFMTDLKNRMKQCWLENPSLKYKTVFEESKAFLISRIPSKDLRKKLMKECKKGVGKSWFHSKLCKKMGRQKNTTILLRFFLCLSCNSSLVFRSFVHDKKLLHVFLLFYNYKCI